MAIEEHLKKKELGNIKLWPELIDNIEMYYYEDYDYIHVFQCPACMMTHMCEGHITNSYYWCFGYQGDYEDLIHAKYRKYTLASYTSMKQRLIESGEVRKKQLHSLRRMYRANITLPDHYD